SIQAPQRKHAEMHLPGLLLPRHSIAKGDRKTQTYPNREQQKNTAAQQKNESIHRSGLPIR
ncbi:hypothetical protein, partial [Sphingobacterium sp. HMSC13C05]|uniref:hypothetical protein n=1 Tax=Sphingobacterium sp. HMSC13C05 TaxID=1581095 RepID=UPI001C305387